MIIKFASVMSSSWAASNLKSEIFTDQASLNVILSEQKLTSSIQRALAAKFAGAKSMTMKIPY
jgi:hypothetical protein